MQDNNVPSHLCRIGNLISDGWERIGKEHNLEIHTEGIAPLPHFAFDYTENQALQTLFTQEMRNRGFLASKSVYVSHSHDEEYAERYLENVNDVFGVIKRAVEEHSVHDLLKGPVAHEGFKRLT
jgi:glutamate-1-semialdehyde 2,1-aminomutase